MAVNDGDGVRIDIGHLESSIKNMMPRDSLMPPGCCIFKIPRTLKMQNEKAFIPIAFSIGPLHHDDQNLKATEKIKAKYLDGLISRSTSPDDMLRTLINSIMKVEKQARECYAEEVHYSAEKFVEILVIDGCFLIEFFRKFVDRNPIGQDNLNDPILSRSFMRKFLTHDLILLENQVPWMVLEILFDLTKHLSDKDIPMTLLASNFLVTNLLDNVLGGDDFWDTDTQFVIMNIKDINHLVDLTRKLSILSTEVKTEFTIWDFLPSATRLVEAGIKFKRGTSRSLLDIKFKDGVLEIPPFKIQESLETDIRNLISYEQCHPNYEARITSYAIFLKSLINTTKDIDILSENEIINNWLNPEDTILLFNKLYHGTFAYYCYADISSQVQSFSKRQWPRWRAMLVRNYFNTPWVTASTSAAIILLLLTLLQTVYSMKKKY